MSKTRRTLERACRHARACCWKSFGRACQACRACRGIRRRHQPTSAQGALGRASVPGVPVMLVVFTGRIQATTARQLEGVRGVPACRRACQRAGLGMPDVPRACRRRTGPRRAGVAWRNQKSCRHGRHAILPPPCPSQQYSGTGNSGTGTGDSRSRNPRLDERAIQYHCPGGTSGRGGGQVDEGRRGGPPPADSQAATGFDDGGGGGRARPRVEGSLGG